MSHSGDRPRRFAYADPPYPGKSRRYYRDHEDYAGEVDHAELIARLEVEFPDGWALSTSAAALQQILPLCPQPRRRAAGGGTRESLRVLAWCKPVSQPGMGGPMYGWEPVIMRGGRRERTRNGPRDWLVCSPELYTFRPRPAGHVTGAKPPAFLIWLFNCLGAMPGDELVDLFPGSGAVALAWQAFARQLPLPDPADGYAEVLGA